MPKESKVDELYVLVIKKKKERDELFNFAIKHNIPITYPSLFKKKRMDYLWGISSSGVGLVGTIIARNTPKDHIVYSIDELKVKFFTK